MFTTYCESRTSDIPFHAVTGLLAPGWASTTSRARRLGHGSAPEFPHADHEDLLLLDDLLVAGKMICHRIFWLIRTNDRPNRCPA